MRHFTSSHFLPFAKQSGQALIYGIFVLLGGLASLFFLFNVGQLSSEKTKLVNTADAVAYSAGVMHARALNFDAYTNRAMMANEVTIAQMVSMSSWIQYSQAHVDAVPPLGCYTIYSVPVALALGKYAPLCYALSWYVGAAAVNYAAQVAPAAAQGAMLASEVAKIALEASQSVMYLAFVPAREALMKEVIDVNYPGETGAVTFDALLDPKRLVLTDDYVRFKGGPFIGLYTGDDRTRFRDAELAATQKDAFVRDRSWSDRSGEFIGIKWPCTPIPRGVADRSGGTTLNGFDEWTANDRASLNVESYHMGLWDWGCKTDWNMSLGSGSQSAKSSSGSSGDWTYTGVPVYYELSKKALQEPDPRLKFSIRLMRAKAQARTSAGSSPIKPAGELKLYQGSEAGGVLTAVATSEVYFARPKVRGDGKKEIGSLFNPYWQVHLITNSPADIAAAIALQIVGGP
jgi:hypothetical protein